MNTKPTIIILHGWGLNGSRYEPLKKLLEKAGYRVYTPDMPGFGESRIPERAYYLSDYADFLREFMEKHAIQSPIVIGHSFGGRVILKYNAMFGGNIRAMILTGTPGFTPVPKKKFIVFVTIAKIGKAITSIWPITIFQESLRSWYYYAVGARDYYRANGVMRKIFKHIVEEDLKGTLASVRCPCMLVWGDSDQITPVWIARKMHQHILNSQIRIIDNTDHGVSFKEPAVFVRTVSPFLKSL